MKLLWSYREKFGRPRTFYTDKASIFQTAEKRKRDDPGAEKDTVECRRRRSAGLTGTGDHMDCGALSLGEGAGGKEFSNSPGWPGERMRMAGVKTIEAANRYMEEDYLVWWERELTVQAASTDDAHRPLEKSHSLPASLSHVELRQVRNDYNFRWSGGLYRIEARSVVSGLRGAAGVRVEMRLDGLVEVWDVAATNKVRAAVQEQTADSQRKRKRGSDWSWISICTRGRRSGKRQRPRAVRVLPLTKGRVLKA